MVERIFALEKKQTPQSKPLPNAEMMETVFDRLKGSIGEHDAQAIYQAVRAEGDFVGFARRFANDDNPQVARNALWTLTKASDKELSELQPILNELIELAMTTTHSAVRRLSMNIVERLEMKEDDVRTDFLDFCLEHMADIEKFPGVQAVCMKIAYRMCRFYPELMGELKRTLEAMPIDYYKPAVRCVRNRILSGKLYAKQS